MSRALKKQKHTGKFIGGWAPVEIRDGIDLWVSRNPERAVSQFLREAFREKLSREGINIHQQN